MFDEPVPTFGRFQVTTALGDGRFGPVHLGIDPESDHVVVIRTFTERITTEQQQRLVEALRQLCERPLDHDSIATPIACGLEGGIPYLAHSYLPGTSVDEFLRTHGPRPLTEVLVRVTDLAAAIDFAAAAEVHHGALSPRDIIFAPHSTGVSGFGLAQAMRDAGVGVNAPTRADDIYALAAMTFELLVGYRFAGGSVRDALVPLRGAAGVDYERLVAALEPTLSGEPGGWPATALAFAGALHEAQVGSQVASTPSPIGRRDVGRLAFGVEESEPVTGRAESSEPLPVSSDASALSMLPAEAVHDVVPLPAEDTALPAEDTAPPAPVWDQLPAPAAFDAPLHTDLAFRDEPPLHAEPSLHEDHTAFSEHTAPTPLPVRDEPRVAARSAGPVIYRPPQRPHPSAPVFTGTPAGSTSGWRVVALGATVAAVLLIAVTVWMFGRQTQTSSAAADGAGISQPAERIDDRQPIAPADAGSPSAADTPEPGSPASPDSSAAASPSTSPSVSGGGPRATAAGVTQPAPVIEEPPTGGSRPDSASARPPSSREAPAAQPLPQVDASEPPSSRAGRSSSGRATDRARVAPVPRVDQAAAVAGGASRPETPASLGRVLVRSTPAGATVSIDGTVRGPTPAAVRDLAFGSHVIVVTAVGYPQWQQTVTLSADRPSQSFEVTLDGSGAAAAAPAATGLQIDSRPSGAQVFVDGTAVGTTPVVLPTVSAGMHAIRIEMAGYRPWSTSATVNSGQRTRVSASLEQ